MDPRIAPSSPAWAADLLAEVNRAFAITGARTPGWPDPHQGRKPAEEEYSRCLDPNKYRILDTRIEAWVETLARLNIAAAREAPLHGAPWAGGFRAPDQLDRIWRIEPNTSGGLVLLLARTVVDGDPFGVDVGIDDPTGSPSAPAFLDTIPACGCDACDDGSDAVLEILDGWFLTVARGGVLHASDGERRMTRTIDGWQSTGDIDESWLDATAQPLPAGPHRWSGKPWL